MSVGSTLTELARRDFNGITEIRPGNYVFFDRTPVRMGLTTLRDVSLTVLVTVVSSNNHYFIVDAGSKVLSSDCPRAGANDTFGSQSYGLAFKEQDWALLSGNEPTTHESVLPSGKPLFCWEVKKLSEEHGWIQQSEGIPAPAIGQRMLIIPNHSCVVANLVNELYVQGNHMKLWTTISRGCTQ